ncbi:MAG: clostripain-related cysteine peptidase [Sideroxyarcus sp.]|nr:clostripain-related cysteine peptidase [Sideroxyarcus sp.]
MVMRLVLAALLSAGLAACGGGGGDNPSGVTGRQWTYMVYMGADNNLSDAGAGDINEMETVGSNDNVAIVVQAEFSSKYSPGLTTPDTRRIYVQNDNNTNSVNLTGTSLGNVNMGAPATLAAFITWAKATYPAEHYALVIWDHGSGWKAREVADPLRGAVQDETSGSFMSLPDLAKAVADSGVHLDIVNFDACLMAMYEVAYEFRGLTDYMVFSEETEPGAGDPYDTILSALKQNPTMSSRTLASTIVDKYNDYYAPNTRESTTKSAVDMAQIDTLDAKIVALSTALDSSTNAVVAAAQANTRFYTYESNHDLFHFCQYLSTNLSAGTAKTLCDEIVAMKGSVVVNSKYTGSMANSQGLAIYIPTAGQTNADELAQYALLKSNLTTRAPATGTWGAYVSALTTGGSGGYTPATGNFSVYISWTKPDGSACDADLDLYINEPDGQWHAPWMGQTSPNGFFSQDSTDSGESSEYYVTNAQVMSGDFDIFANFYANGSSCTQARVHLWILDSVTYGDTNWHEPFAAVDLDLSNDYTSGCATFSCMNTYSDWWWAGWMTRLSGGGALSGNQALPNPGKSINLMFKQKKDLPSRLNK